MATDLPLPVLTRGACDGIAMLVDGGLLAACGVRMGFTERAGGVSEGPYASLNLGNHVNDNPRSVAANRARLANALGVSHAQLIVPRQVHGVDLVRVSVPEEASVQQRRAQAGVDGVVVACPDVAALLCFADCMPVVLVAPGGAFAVVHAGWRGVYGRIVPKALDALCHAAGARASDCNAYIGPYIHAECFEVSADLADRFGDAFGSDCVADDRHVDLGAAMRTSLLQAGADPDRIADARVCTVCARDRFFSYRAQGGVCGRHGAFAVRVSRDASQGANGDHAADGGKAAARQRRCMLIPSHSNER
jgi:YfiH family protein